MAFTCDLLKDGMEAIKILGAIRMEEDMQGGARAPDGSRPLVATDTLDNRAVTIVSVTDLNIVILAHVVKLQAQHDKPASGEGDRRNRWATGSSGGSGHVQGHTRSRWGWMVHWPDRIRGWS